MKKIFVFSGLFLLLISCGLQKNHFAQSWTHVSDRVWVGSEFWSNRLQDWKVQNGRLECVANDPKLLMRTTHLINLRLAAAEGDFSGKIEMGALQAEQNEDAACGFLIGAGPRLDVWGASLVQQKTGPGAGLFAGINTSGILFLRDMETGKDLGSVKMERFENKKLSIAIGTENSDYSITLKCGDGILIIPSISPERLSGNIALVSHPGTGKNPGSFWFNNLEVGGSKLILTEETAGPIISSQYTLSRDILKLTAQLAPIGDADPSEVFLEVQKEGKWVKIAETSIITPGYTATFRIAGWNSAGDTHYRVKYVYHADEQKDETAFWEGTVRHDPVEKEEIVIAGFTGNHNVSHSGLSGNGTFSFDSSGIWYPHRDIVRQVKFQNPDVLFFSGDQVYEGASPTYADTKNYELDYLYKWYLYCLAYRHLTCDIPTISIPDDHDVYQGNLWGQGGRFTDKDDKGGYVHPAWFVQMVERTQCSNLPDPYDPAPVEQNIGVYYTSMTYGGIGFAVLEDRKFKSGCADNPFITRGRPDHVIDPAFEIKKIDIPGKELLGSRQLKFLQDWTTNWKGEDMKIALSQTIFAGMATHHGGELFRVIGDLDSNGWPQTGRNMALDALRKAFALHLAGDQHLASLVHQGIDDWDDAIYSFCVPSIANFYPRAWWPDAAGIYSPENGAANLGKHKDGFGNLVTVYAVTNPTGFTQISTGSEPLRLNDNMPGYGIVRMNKTNRTYRMECWPRDADPADETQQYTGWPKTISQSENYERKAFAWLPTVVVKGVENPVIEVVDEETGDLVYCVRIMGAEFEPKVFKQGTYHITLKDTQNDISKVFEGVNPMKNPDEKLVVVF